MISNVDKCAKSDCTHSDSDIFKRSENNLISNSDLDDDENDNKSDKNNEKKKEKKKKKEEMTHSEWIIDKATVYFKDVKMISLSWAAAWKQR